MSHTYYCLISIAKIILCFSLLIVSSGHADTLEVLNGQSFTDPKMIMAPKNEVWLKQPISYPKKYQDADIFLTLDQQLYPALLPLINQYAQQQQLNIQVHEGTCGISSGMLGRKEADIGGYCCPPGHTDRLHGLEFHTLGISSIVFFVNPNNIPIDNITFSQLQKVFSGDIQRWSDIHNKAKPNLIHPVARLHCKLRPGHWRLILDNEEMFSARLNEVSAIPDMISLVANDPNAIGYETLWMTKHYRDKGKLKWIKIDGIAAEDNEALAKGKYPVYRTFNITSWDADSMTPYAKSDYAKNEKAQKLVKYLVENISQVNTDFELIPVQKLINNGWKFHRGELIGEPDK